MKKGEKMSEKQKEQIRLSNIKTWSSPAIRELQGKIRKDPKKYAKPKRVPMSRRESALARGFGQIRIGTHHTKETKEKQRIRGLWQGREWRDFVFKRDDYTCQICFKRGGKLEADHIVPFSYILKKNNITTIEEAIECAELWDINNGRTLCVDCHKKTNTYGLGTKNYKE